MEDTISIQQVLLQYGSLDERTEDRKGNSRFIKYLRAEGHTVYDCTDDIGKTENANLVNIVKNCNSHTVDLDVSIHLNSGRNDLSGDNSTGGVEVFIYDKSSNSPVEEAERVCAAISKKLGLHNRGVKVCGNNLYVVAKTKAPAMLVSAVLLMIRTTQTDGMLRNVLKPL